MYKRYYDGYGTYRENTSPYIGEVIIPTKSDEDSISTAKANSQPSRAEENNEMEFTVHDSETAVAAMQRGNSNPLNGISRLLDDIALDDIILIGVILLVLKDSADDPLLIIILAVIFISGFIE